MSSSANALPGDVQVFWIHSSGRLLDTSERAAQVLGYSRQELRGLTVWDIDPASSEALWRR
jgi:PAS domain S-box-containing protein